LKILSFYILVHSAVAGAAATAIPAI